MSGSPYPITCCDRDCANANYCFVGGIQCESCGLWFCASDLNEDGYCEECERQRSEERRRMTKDTHTPCKFRKREVIDGVELDMCYAIGFERIGDMPCEYCVDWRNQEIPKTEKKI